MPHPRRPPCDLRRRPRRPRPGHPRRPAAGHGHGRRRRRALRPGQPREQAAAGARGAATSRSPTAWPSRSHQLAAEPDEFRAERGAFHRRPDQPLRPGRRPAGRRARRADRALPGPRVRAGARVLPLRARPPARPTSTGCRCATRGRRSTAARRWCSTATRRYRRRSGSTTRSASTPAACSAAASPRCATPSGSSSSVPARRGLLRAGQAVPGQAPDAVVPDARPPRPGRPRHRRRDRQHASSRRPTTPRIGVREENAAAALEVMSRFAIDPRWLLYLPPTMSPVATSTAAGPARTSRAGLRRLPGATASTQWSARRSTWARARWRWSAATLEAARAGSARPVTQLGAVWTRTGRPFFAGPSSPAQFVGPAARRRRDGRPVRRAGHAAGCCWTPSCCPGAPRPGSCSGTSTRPSARRPRASLPVAVERARPGGGGAASTCGDCSLERDPRQELNADAFTDAYRPLLLADRRADGVRIAPFQLLAAEGARPSRTAACLASRPG